MPHNARFSKIANRVGEKHGIIKKDVSLVFTGCISEIVERIARGERVFIKNLGTFKLRKIKARMAINPKNIAAGKFEVPTHMTIRFKPTPKLKKAVLQLEPRDDY